MTLRRRYKPSWGDNGDDREVLLGFVGPLDVYYENNHNDNGQHWCIVVGPEDRKLNGRDAHNFDVYIIEDRSRLEPHGSIHPRFDLHIELYEMCEIMKVLQERGLMDG